GIGTQEVTDAVLKGGSAWDDIQAKIQSAKNAYHDQANALIASGGATDAVGQMTTELEDNNAAAEALDKTMQENRGSFQKGIADNRQMAEAAKAAGIDIKKQADAQGNLVLQSGKLSQALGAAAAASTVLNDSFSSNTAKIDAMRRTFEILVPPNAKQKVAESLGAYVTGLNSIRDSAVSLAPQMQKLGDTVYGEKGFLNVAGGNKAVLQLNQALIDEVNNVWAGAKAAYDAAIAQGKTAQQAFQESQDFIKKHKGDYDQLATDSGVAADKVQGQWDAVFGHEWVLRVSLSGATEAAAKAQAMVTALHGTFDGKKFLAYLDANPDAALKAITDADGAARDYVNHEWKAKLDALPKPAQDRIQALLKMTDEEWNKGDFEATLKAAQNIPGLSEALVKIYNGVKGPFQAQILAALDYGSLGYVQARLDMLANQKRYVHFGVTIDDIQRDQVLAGRGRNGAIVNGSGRGMSGFGLEPIKYFANGGIERHVAQITKPGGPIRVWSEKETQGEAYVPYAMSKRPRSVAILSQVAKDFGYTLNRTERFANGGLAGTSSVPTTTTSTSVTVGTINTVDPEAAIQKLRTMQRDALAVAGII
ncbi:MAG TPA: hypothetical protein VLJ40_10190, partial [Arthrobacter sp.]|nr:hypothetical protein [Arthrobacter sp.]